MCVRFAPPVDIYSLNYVTAAIFFLVEILWFLHLPDCPFLSAAIVPFWIGRGTDYEPV